MYVCVCIYIYIYIYIYIHRLLNEWIYIFIHSVVCLTTGPKPLPKRALHIVRSRDPPFKWEYPFLSLRSSNSFLRLLPRLPVTSIPPFIFPSITRCRRQFQRKMWSIQFAFCLGISCRIFLCSLTLSNTSSFLTWSVQLIFSILLQHHISQLSRCFWSTARSVQVYVYSNTLLNYRLIYDTMGANSRPSSLKSLFLFRFFLAHLSVYQEQMSMFGGYFGIKESDEKYRVID